MAALRRAQPIHNHDRLRAAAAVGLKPLRKQEPATTQRRMFCRRHHRSFNARQKHGLIHDPQCVADDHLPLARKGERSGDAFAGRSGNGVAEVSRTADAERGRRGSVLNEERGVHGARHAGRGLNILGVNDGRVPVSVLGLDRRGDGRIHIAARAQPG